MPLMAALGPDDKIATHHRNHGHVLARGADPKLALAEILGRENGFNRGAGGTMHMSDTDRGFISTSAIVGGSISLATGAGFALKSQGGDAIAVGAVRRRRARGGRLVRVAQPRRPVGAAGPLRLREQQRGRARLGGRRLPHLGLGRRRPDRHPAHVRDPGRDRRRARPRGGLRGRGEGRRAHARAQGAVLRPRGDGALRRHAAALADAADRRDRHLDGLGRLRHLRRARAVVPRARPGAALRAAAARRGRDRPGRADRARRARARAARPRRASSRSTAPDPRPKAHSTTSSPEEARDHGNQELRRRDAGCPHDVHGGGPQLRRHRERGARDRPRGHAVRRLPGEVRRPHLLPALLRGGLLGPRGRRGDVRPAHAAPSRASRRSPTRRSRRSPARWRPRGRARAAGSRSRRPST